MSGAGMIGTEPAGVLPRIAAVRRQVMGRHGSRVSANPFARDVALWRAARRGMSRVQQRAAFLLELVRISPIEIPPDWRLAGEHLPHQFGVSQGEPDESARARLAELGLTDEQVEQVWRTVRIWAARPGWSPSLDGPQYYAVGEEDDRARPGAPARQPQTGQGGVFIGRGWSENHSIRDFAKVLRIGFDGLRGEVRERLDRAGLADPDYPRRESFWRAALSICEAGILLGRRYAELAEQLAPQAHDAAEKARLEAMAAACRQVPARGARTFFEAVQSLWLAHVLTCGEDGINANSIGRLDQVLWPYYQADVRAGRLDRPGALELMEELACKLHLDYNVQAITLGGVDADGRDATNELTYVILEATRDVGLIRDLSVRLHRRSPPELLALSAELILRGGGIPFLFNDEVFIPALTARGIALADARDYAPIGCVELTIPGKASPHAVSGQINCAKCLELALFDGLDVRSGEQVGPQTGRLGDFDGLEAFYAAYTRQVEFFAERMVYHCNRGELAQRERGPLPCLSVMTDDCIARGRDITDGGAVYNYHSVCMLGTANVADSMMAMKKLLFEEKRIAPQTLLEALRADFEGHEPLRRMLARAAPKYGNDCQEVDELARRIDADFIALMDRMRSPLGARYFVHLFSFKWNLDHGRCTGATPDGRRAGEPLAYSLSAHQGRDVKGITAMLRSLARLPHAEAAGGSAAIVEVDPALVGGDEGLGRLSQLIRTAFDMGVGQLQWNVTTVERLRLAQKDPERYGNIAVRVAGYSQMFRLIDPELQEHIIARTKHRT